MGVRANQAWPSSQFLTGRVSRMLLSPAIGLLVSPDGASRSNGTVAAVRGDEHAMRDALAEHFYKSVASQDEGRAATSRRLVRRERHKRATGRERVGRSRFK